MKKFVLFFFFIAIANLSYSQIVNDNFDYPAGNPLTSHGWVNVSGTPNTLLVSSPGLTFPDYAGSGIGNAASLGPSSEDVALDFPANITSGSLYASAMINVSSAATTATGDYLMHFTQGASTSNFYARLFVKNEAGNLAFGVSKGAATTGSPLFTPASYSLNTTYLVVIKYTFVAGATNDEVSLFVFDSALPVTEPTPNVGPFTTTQADAVNIGRISLRQSTATTSAIVDGIYVDDTWNNTTLPVELASFTSSVSGRNVDLKWSTASELNNNGFEVERAINGVWSKVGFVNGNGTTNDAHNYSFTDRNLASGSYSYRLKQVDFNGNFEYHNLTNEVIVGVPSKFELSQNYPNPFNPSTTINFDVPFDSKVSLTIFDMSGKEISMIVNEAKTAGYYSVNFNAASLSSGIYFYSLKAGDFVSTKKMILVK